ncbi:hypothetical protein QFZ26_001094 [Agromyces ramosus]|uniref:Uncharacterized protein n=1 Tax=Agromyces ramosus TaxID=33879 RepID=A0ABU0R627_9MICO|nr:hypothetical protein [Agromyces ramosus]
MFRTTCDLFVEAMSAVGPPGELLVPDVAANDEATATALAEAVLVQLAS